MQRVESTFANAQNNLAERVDIPNLHHTAANGLRQAILRNASGGNLALKEDKAVRDKQSELKYNCLHSIAARNRDGRFCDLHCWPTPREAAT